MPIAAWQRRGTELMWAPIFTSEDELIGSSLAFELHCSVFKKRFPDVRAPWVLRVGGTHTPGSSRILLPGDGGATRAHPRTRECWCQPVPSFRALEERKPACGATGKTTDLREGCQTTGPFRKRTRAHLRFPTWSTCSGPGKGPSTDQRTSSTRTLCCSSISRRASRLEPTSRVFNNASDRSMPAGRSKS